MSRATSDTINIFITNIIHQNTSAIFKPKQDITVINILLIFISFVFIFTGCSLYNEIIIIHLSGFATDTKQEIMHRAIIDCRQLTTEKDNMLIEDSFSKHNEGEMYSQTNTSNNSFAK